MVHFLFDIQPFFFLFRVWTRKKYFAMKVLFVPFKNWEFRKKWTRADAYTYKIWWCWKKKKEKTSFIHDLCKWSISFSFSFLIHDFKKILFFLEDKKRIWKKEKNVVCKLNFVIIYFQKTTCVEMEMEVRNRNDEKKMNEDEEEESFHNDKLVLFCNLKLRKKNQK